MTDEQMLIVLVPWHEAAGRWATGPDIGGAIGQISIIATKNTGFKPQIIAEAYEGVWEVPVDDDGNVLVIDRTDVPNCPPCGREGVEDVNRCKNCHGVAQWYLNRVAMHGYDTISDAERVTVKRMLRAGFAKFPAGAFLAERAEVNDEKD